MVRQTCDYVIREMTDASGAFWSAQDAEVDGLEGGNYLWRPPEVNEAIPDAALANLALTMYGLNLGPNFQDPHHPEAPPGNVLYLPKKLNVFAEEQQIGLPELLESKKKIDGMMLATRNQRKQPGTDDKVLTAWNGIMIAGMARAGAELQEPKYHESAVLAARAVLDLMRTDDGGLRRTMRKGVAKIPGFLDDYAFFIHGLIELHRADRDDFWLQTARKLTAMAEGKFGASGGGYFDTLADQADLFVRTRSTYDGAIPSANSQMVHNLLDLYEITREDDYLQQAVMALRSFAGAMRRHGAGMARMQQALLRAMEMAPDRFRPGALTPVSNEGRRQVVALEVDNPRVDLSSGSGKVTLTLRIGPEYHLNAHVPGTEGFIATTLELQDGEGLELEVNYPPGTSKKFPFADRPIQVYEGTIALEATLRRAGKAPPPAAATLVLRYQVCTEMSCLEPKTAEIPLKIG